VIIRPEAEADDVRRGLTRRFPYAVYYRIAGVELVVLGILHTHRDPREWRSRASRE